MKKLYFIAIVFFIMSVVKAQQLAPKDIAGTWHIALVSFNGNGIDFEHDGVFVSDTIKQRMNTEESAIYTEQLYGALNRFHDMTVTLTQGGDLVLFMDNNTQKGVFSLEYKDGLTYLTGGGVLSAVVTLPGGLMQWLVNDGDEMIMRFKKQ
ncbi:MAG: hypothetical protein EOP54_21890 [Sphingobacteriales bacterium]|nr:MAG: hypothetical protein EOP54_21890 [Sphingobacteriales bacterium]